jgi:hypothetical protein
LQAVAVAVDKTPVVVALVDTLLLLELQFCQQQTTPLQLVLEVVVLVLVLLVALVQIQ